MTIFESGRVRCAALAAGAAIAAAIMPLSASADETPATFISIGPLYYTSSTYYDKSGKVQPSPCTFQKDGYSLYVQQQINAGDQARLSTEYDDDSCGGSSTRGLTDIELDYLKGIGGRAHPSQFQVEVSAITPTGYAISDNPRLGFGRPAGELGGLYNGTFKAGSLYGYVQAGANVRVYTSYPAPQPLSNVTAGLNFSHKLLYYESFYGTTHLGAGGTLTNIGQNPTLNAVYDSYTISENVAYAFWPRTSLALTYQSQLGGWNTGIGSTLQAGLWLRF